MINSQRPNNFLEFFLEVCNKTVAFKNSYVIPEFETYKVRVFFLWLTGTLGDDSAD